MLSSVQGLVFFFGAPLLLKESPKWKNLFGLIISIIGLNFILSSRTAVNAPIAGVSILASKSILFGVCSGVFGGIAYLLMARCRKTDCNEVISFYWAVPSLLMQLLIIFYGHNQPIDSTYSHNFTITNTKISNLIWLCAFLGGVLTAVSQILLAEAYRYGNVVLLSLITYLGPLINLIADLIFGKILFNDNLMIGVLLIIFGSGVFPLLNPTSLRLVINRLY
jgi:drug/metabolite transporter (DMT)-like permease